MNNPNQLPKLKAIQCERCPRTEIGELIPPATLTKMKPEWIGRGAVYLAICYDCQQPFFRLG